jgi:HSP20 family protein
MAIQRWDPLRDLRELQQKMNHLFDDAFSRSAGPESVDPLTTGGWKPSTDLIEEDDRYVLRCDLPGVAAADVEIRIENGTLFLRGERKIDAGISQESYLRVERPSGAFAVKIALAPSVDQKRVRAAQRNGVLEVLLPKRKAELSNQVEVTAGETGAG